MASTATTTRSSSRIGVTGALRTSQSSEALSHHQGTSTPSCSRSRRPSNSTCRGYQPCWSKQKP
eukprot:5160113-Alexandrium_andersonii.AAC.1